MKIFGANWSTGAICGSVVLSLFLLTVVLGFPGLFAFIAALSSVKIGGIAAVVAVVCIIFLLDAVFPRSVDSVAKYVMYGLQAVAILVVGLAVLWLIYMGVTTVVGGSIAVVSGLPVDSYGTVIPVSPITVFSLHAVTLVGAFCFARHVVYKKLVKHGGKLSSVIISGLVTGAILLTFQTFTTGLIYASYRDDFLKEKALFMREIEYHQSKVDRLKEGLKNLELEHRYTNK